MKRTGIAGPLIFLLSVILAGFALSDLEFRLYPSTSDRYLGIRTLFEGASAEEIDRSVTGGIYDLLSRLDGVREIRSVSTRGESRVYLSLFPETDSLEFQNELSLLLSSIEKRLPPQALPPILSTGSSDPEIVYMVAFPEEEKEKTRAFARRLESLGGVARVDTVDQSGLQIAAELDTRASSSARFDPGTAARALQDASRGVVTGCGPPFRSQSASVLRIPPDLILRKDGSLTGAANLPRHLGELLTLTPRPVPPSRIERVNGTPVNIVAVLADADGGIISLCRQMEKIRARFPEAELLFNRGIRLSSVLRATAFTVILGIGTVVLLLLLQTGGFRHGQEYILLTLPVSLSLAILLLSLLDLSLDIMSLSGIAVASGLIVDTAVLFFEESSAHGTRAALLNLRGPILVANGTTLVTFVPILLMPLEVRSLFHGFMTVIAVSLAAGSAWTLLVLPSLDYGGPPEVAVQAGMHRRYRIVLRSTAWFTRLPLILPAAALLLGFAFLLYSPTSFSPFPFLQTDSLTIEAQVPGGMNPDYVERVILPAAEYIGRRTGTGNLQITTSAAYGQGSIRIRSPDRDTLEASALLARNYAPPAGVSLLVRKEALESTGVRLILYGNNPDRLRNLIFSLSTRISEEVSEARVFFHFRDQAPTQHISFVPERCFFHRLTPLEAARQISHSFSSAPSAKLQNGRDHDLFVRPVHPFERMDIFFQETMLSTPGGGVNLSSISMLHEQTSPEKMLRHNGALYTGLTVISKDCGAASKTAAKLERLLSDYPLPAGYHLDIAPELRKTLQLRSRIVSGTILAAILVLLVIYGYYENLSRTLTVLLHIPPPVIVSLLFLRFTRTGLSIPVLSGMLVIIGISINNIVVLLPRDRPSMREKSLQESLPQLRLKLSEKLPSLAASTLTTVAGVGPLLVGGISGSGLPAGLSIVVAAGSLTAFLLLFLTCGILESPFRKKLPKMTRRPGSGTI